MFLKKTIFYLNVFLLAFHTNAQERNIPIGTWRVHLPYNIIYSVETGGNRTYASGKINAFSIDRADNSLEILSTVNALNDIEITKMKYHTSLGLLVIGYVNGNIDILRSDNITINVNDIKRKNIIGSKRINHIYFRENFAYLSCDFGVSVLDLTRYEIKETYSNLAPAGLPNQAYATTFSSDADSIFIATEKGLMAAKNSPFVNLMDFNNWYTYGPANSISTTGIKTVCTLGNKIYAGIENDSISYLTGSTWVKSDILLSNVKSMNVSQGKMLICSGSRLIVAENETTYSTITHSSIPDPSEAVIDENNHFWIADLASGLQRYDGSTYLSIMPDGPISNEVFHLHYYNNKIVVSRGGYNNGYTFAGNLADYFVYNNEYWSAYSSLFTAGMPDARDIVSASYNAYDNKLYLATYGTGVVVDNLNGTYTTIDDTTGPFERALATPGPYVFISDIEPDKNGNLWITNPLTPSSSDPSLHVKKTDGTWTSKSFGFEGARYPMEILIDDNDYKWLRLRPDIGGGLIVYNDASNTHKYLSDLEGQGGLPNKSVRAIVKDKKGEIWVGTEEGIAIFYNPENIFSASPSDAVTPIYEGFPLLYNEFITCIEVDGGNRKWVGTKNGIWLFNDDGSEVLSNFTMDNSPLFSNIIIDIEINDLTGEIFIATDKGLISYRGGATEGKLEHSNVNVFPNPVKPDFQGLVGISGLTSDAVVKITDIYGNLIYETKAEGGTAVWNAKNYNGEKARTGVYLIFSASEDGEETYVAKIAVVE